MRVPGSSSAKGRFVDRLALERAGMGERIVEYDLIRVVAIMLVVLIHVLSPFFNAGAVMLGELDVVKLLSREIRFVVPMYVVLTGVLVWGRAAESARNDWRSSSFVGPGACSSRISSGPRSSCSSHP